MWRLTAIVLILVGSLSDTASACSFGRGYQAFNVGDPSAWEPGMTPITSGMSVHSLTRGSDDGNFASCSDAGVLTITIDQPELALGLGYIFELESGRFPDKVFPDAIISPRELRDSLWGFSFVWLDLPSGRSKVRPIDVIISVRAVSPTMDLGKKVFLDIRDP